MSRRAALSLLALAACATHAVAGVVTISRLPAGGLEIRGNDCRLVYTPHGAKTRNAGLAAESRIHGQRLMDAHAVWGGPHLRWVGYLEGYGVHSQTPWTARIVQTGQAAAGFTTESHTTHFYDAAVTHVFFWDLPEVVLFDVAQIKRRAGPGSEANGINMCAFTTDRYLYNGMRYWNDDAGPYPLSMGSGPAGTLTGSDPVNGFFTHHRGGSRYLQPHLVRNLLLAQRDGANGPENPPCGWIFRSDFDTATTTDDGGYYAHMVVLKPPVPPQVGGRVHVPVLWVQGGAGNMRTLDRILALEAAFRRPMVVATAGSVVTARDTAGLHRPWEIVLLGPECRRLVTPYPIFRGSQVVAVLLRDVRPGQRVEIGRLQEEGRQYTGRPLVSPDRRRP